MALNACIKLLVPNINIGMHHTKRHLHMCRLSLGRSSMSTGICGSDALKWHIYDTVLSSHQPDAQQYDQYYKQQVYSLQASCSWAYHVQSSSVHHFLTAVVLYMYIYMYIAESLFSHQANHCIYISPYLLSLFAAVTHTFYYSNLLDFKSSCIIFWQFNYNHVYIT